MIILIFLIFLLIPLLVFKTKLVWYKKIALFSILFFITTTIVLILSDFVSNLSIQVIKFQIIILQFYYIFYVPILIVFFFSLIWWVCVWVKNNPGEN
jgi:hypothetical protein